MQFRQYSYSTMDDLTGFILERAEHSLKYGRAKKKVEKAFKHSADKVVYSVYDPKHYKRRFQTGRRIFSYDVEGGNSKTVVAGYADSTHSRPRHIGLGNYEVFPLGEFLEKGEVWASSVNYPIRHYVFDKPYAKPRPYHQYAGILATEGNIPKYKINKNDLIQF